MDASIAFHSNSGALAVLKKALQLKREDSDLIFPSPQGGGIIDQSTLSRCAGY